MMIHRPGTPNCAPFDEETAMNRDVDRLRALIEEQGRKQEADDQAHRAEAEMQASRAAERDLPEWLKRIEIEVRCYSRMLDIDSHGASRNKPTWIDLDAFFEQIDGENTYVDHDYTQAYKAKPQELLGSSFNVDCYPHNHCDDPGANRITYSPRLKVGIKWWA
jgi:hypothetical protein